MKNHLKSFLAICLCCIFPLMLSSCSKKHNFSTEWTTDSEYHWHICTDENCNEESDKATHTWDNGTLENHKMVYTCTVCHKQKTEDLAHSYSSWSFDEENHWKECSVDGCTEKIELAEHNFDEGTVSGHNTIYKCQTCGYEKSTPNNHINSKVWSSDDENHWQICTIDGCDEKINLESHNWDKGVVSGHKITYTCLTCEKTKVEDSSHEAIPNHYEYDDENHWEICKINGCNEKMNIVAHDWGEGTLIDHNISYTCKICKAQKTEKAPHTFSNDWTSDNYGHWHACTIEGCTEKSDYYVHALLEDGSCSICGKTITDCEEHNFNLEWTFDDENHWHACSSSTCSVREDFEAHNFDDGVVKGHQKIYTCKCGKVKEVDLDHNVSETWSKNELYHWHICTIEGCGMVLDKSSHNFDEGTLKDHKMTYKCLDCGYEKIVDVEHQFGSEWLSDGEYHWHTCTIDGCTATSEKVAHSWSNADVYDHKNHLTCTICGKTYTEEIPHNYESEWIKNETHHWHICTVSGCTEKEDYAEHTFDEGIIKNHQLVKTCSGCGYEEIIDLEHNFSQEWSKDETHHWHACTVSGCTEKEDYAEHTFDEGTLENHKMHYTCSCGYSKDVDLPHNFSETWSSDETYHWHSCSVDGCTEVGAKEKHILNYMNEDEETITYHCPICDKDIVVSNDKYIKAIENFAKEKYGVKLSDVTIKSKIVVDIKFAELCISKDENGKLYGYGSGTIVEPDKLNELMTVKFLIDGEDAYFYYNKNTNSYDGDTYVKVNLVDYLKTAVIALANKVSLPLDSIIEMLNESKDEISETLTSILDSIKDCYKDNRIKLNEAVKFFVENFFTSVSDEKNVVYTFNFEKIEKFNEYLENTKIKDIINSKFGANTYNALTVVLMQAPGMTVESIVELLKEQGIDVYQILDDIDAKIAEVYAFIMGFMGQGTETIDESATPIEPIEPEEPTMTAPKLEDIINLILEKSGKDIKIGDIGEIITSMKDMTVTDIINLIVQPKQDYTVQDLQIMISEKLTTYGDMTVYQIAESYMIMSVDETNEEEQETNHTIVYSMISSILEMLKTNVSIKFTTDGNGTISNVNINVDFDAFGGTLELIKDYKTEAKYDDLKTELNSLTFGIEFLEKNFKFGYSNYTETIIKNEDGTKVLKYSKEEKKSSSYSSDVYEFVFDEKGNLVTYKNYIEYSYTGTNYTQSYSYTTEASINFENNIEIDKLCGNWLCIYVNDLSGKYEYTSFENNVTTTSVSIPCVLFYYNTLTKEFSLTMSNFEDASHIYEDKDVTIVETSYGYLVCKTCKTCGDKIYIEVLSTLSGSVEETFCEKYDEYVSNNKIENSNIENAYFNLVGTDFYYAYNIESGCFELVDVEDLTLTGTGIYAEDYGKLYSFEYRLFIEK